MNKIKAICLKCGNVQVRTDVCFDSINKYVLLNKKIFCPKCNSNSKFFATKDLDKLRKNLELKQESDLDMRILKIIAK